MAGRKNRSQWTSGSAGGKNRAVITLGARGSSTNSTSTRSAPRRTRASTWRVSRVRNQPRWTKTVWGQSRKFSTQAWADASKRVRMRNVVQPRSPRWGKRKGPDGGAPAPMKTHT